MAERTRENTSAFLMRTEMAADGGVTGVVNRLSCGEAVSFAGLDQALLMINEWLDEEKPLSEDMILRTFRTGRRKRPVSGAVNRALAGEAGCAGTAETGCAGNAETGCARIAGTDGIHAAETDLSHLAGLGRRGDARRREAFLVRIICRQHNSWQGEVCWKAQRLYFRSTLELMCLIHSALDPGAAKTKSAAGTIVRPVFRVV